MVLNLRAAMDPRFAFHHRPVVDSTMGFIRGTLYRAAVPEPSTQQAGWKPSDADPDLRAPAPSVTSVPIYRGPARIQPQLGWRARKQNSRDGVVTEGGYVIQLSMRLNELRDAPVNYGVQYPSIEPNDFFRVEEVFSWGGVEIDPQIKTYDYIVRTLTPGSNSWVRSLTCDVQPGTLVSNGQD